MAEPDRNGAPFRVIASVAPGSASKTRSRGAAGRLRIVAVNGTPLSVTSMTGAVRSIVTRIAAVPIKPVVPRDDAMRLWRPSPTPESVADQVPSLFNAAATVAVPNETVIASACADRPVTISEVTSRQELDAGE